MLRTVAPEAHIDRVSRGVIRVPQVLAIPLPAVGNRISYHDQIDVSLADPLQYELMPRHPPVDMSAGRRRNGFVRLACETIRIGSRD